MISPTLARHICLGALVLLIQPVFGPLQASATRLAPAAWEEAQNLDKLPPVKVPHLRQPPTDRSGRVQVGKASFYAAKFNHHRMADGRRFIGTGSSAASKTLPLGTVAKVVNLKTGKSAIVKVEDRGPYPRDSVLDVSLQIAEHLGMEEMGVAAVLIKPIAVPQPGGGIKLGAGAAEASPQQVQRAVRTARELTQTPRHRRSA